MMSDRSEVRRKWYEDAPLCGACGKNQVHIAEAHIGFFGLQLTYFKDCNACLPEEVAREAEEIKKTFLKEEA